VTPQGDLRRRHDTTHRPVAAWRVQDGRGRPGLLLQQAHAELGGSLMALLFENLSEVKHGGTELKSISERNIPKIKAAQFDVLMHTRPQAITIMVLERWRFRRYGCMLELWTPRWQSFLTNWGDTSGYR
jgi:hypothetical protein